jgi:hypothetical protein
LNVTRRVARRIAEAILRWQAAGRRRLLTICVNDFVVIVGNSWYFR